MVNTEKKAHVVDRAGWPSGPWDHEGDREEWRHVSGLPCLMVRADGTGAWCGYVGVPPGHLFYGKDYEEPDVDVHGGLTYAGKCQENGPICHVAQPGEPEPVWWFGFDCAHGGDIVPSWNLLAFWPGADVLCASYRDRLYVRREVERLADQLAQSDGSYQMNQTGA